jgi:hypothetical protein
MLAGVMATPLLALLLPRVYATWAVYLDLFVATVVPGVRV